MGARGTNEDAYAFARLMKGVIGTDNVDAETRRRAPGRARAGVRRAEIADCDRAAAIVLLGPDLEEELPVLHLRVRRAVVELGVPLVDLAAVAHGLSEHATVVARTLPGEELGAAALELIREARGDRPGPVVVVLGRPSFAESAAVAMRRRRCAAEFPTWCSSRRCAVATCTARWTPDWFPDSCRAAVTLDGAGPGSPRRGADRCPRPRASTRGILEAAAAGKIEVLVILGSDPVADFPDVDLAGAAMAGSKKIIAVGAFLTGTSARSEVVLPPTLAGEKNGTLTNLEGRVQRVNRKVAPEGGAMDDWRIALELALAARHRDRHRDSSTSSPTSWPRSPPRSQARRPRCCNGRVTAWCSR